MAPPRDKLLRSLTLHLEVECTFMHDVMKISCGVIKTCMNPSVFSTII